ncbi:MAG: ABC transporter permease [Oscillospiraceae bacterium]
MIKVNNKKAVSNLASKSFRANKTRNIIAIIAIALTAILFTSLFTMGIGTVEALQQATIRQSGGDGHAALKYIDDEEFDAIKDHPLINEIAYNRILADEVENDEFIKRHTEFWYYDDVGLKLGFCEPTTGTRPQKENEVIADTETLQLMGVPLEIGAPLSLKLKIRDETVTRDFVLSGWWESDDAFNVGQVFSSRAYVDAHEKELQRTYDTDHSLAGCICAYVMFENSLDLESKLAELINESGFSMIDSEPNFMASNVNWAYLSTNFSLDAGTLVGLGSAILLVVLTGYLIIYNIFQISVVRDIRFYGLLKTIGTTARQIRRIIRRQALLLSVIGIPIGLFLGFFSGRALVPLLMSNTSYGGSSISISPNPLIFLGAAAFALITVLISTLRPSRVAASVSPVEAVRFTDNGGSKKVKFEKRTRGAKISQMARANMGRNKKRTVLVVLSLSLSLILLNTVLTLSGSLDMDKFISKFVDTDFLIAHADYFNFKFMGQENSISESFIEAVKAQDGFEKGGRLYGGRENIFFASGANSEYVINRNELGDAFCALYGLEDLPLERLTLLDGEIDKEKLLSGKYILEGVLTDDNEVPKWDSANFKVGDKVLFHNYRDNAEHTTDAQYTDLEFEVLGHVAVKTYTNCDRSLWGCTFYLPAEVYTSLVDTPIVMSYALNVADENEADFEDFLKNYTDKIEPNMNYDSKGTSSAAFDGMRSTILMVGCALGGIIGFIGILNFINSMLTSIFTRRREFAMLQSIGMTRRQLRQMLCMEGLSYAFLTILVSILLGIISSLLIVKVLCGQMWFLTYHFILWPLLAAIPILLILGVLIPLISFHASDKASIVERLRETE